MVVYKNLTASVVYALALMGNEEATKSLKTSDFDKVKAMRKILQTKFQGIFSTEFQSHIYMMFNAVCSFSPEEEKKRKKKMQHLLRMSTMDEECWGLIAEIISLNPSICLSAFRDLGGLGQKQSLDLLRKLENKEIKLSELKRLAKEMEPSPTEPLTFQRLREQKKKSKNVAEDKRQTDKPQKQVSKCSMKSTREEQLEMELQEVRRKLAMKIKSEKQQMEELAKMRKEKNELILQIKNLQVLKKRCDEMKTEASKLKNTVSELNAKNAELESLRCFTDQTEQQTSPETSIIVNVETGTEESASSENKEGQQVPGPSALDESLPFSVYVKGSNIKTKEKNRKRKLVEDGLTETLTLCAVEWSGGKVYIGAIIKNRFTYCKSPIGQIKVIDDKTVYASKEASGSLQLNPSDDIDTKDLNKQYIIWEGQGQIIGYRIIRNSVDFMDFEKHVDAYVK